MSESKTKVAIVGGGPAGIAASQQCTREGIDDVLLLERKNIGGLIYQANRIENFPGFVGKEGREMVNELGTIVSEYDIDVEFREVEKIESARDGFKLITETGKVRTTYLILATGTAPRSLGFEGEVHHPEWRNYDGESVIVIGGGDAAYDYALRMKRLGGDVTILRRSEPKALPVLVREAREKGIEEVEASLEEVEKDDDFSLRCDGMDLRADVVVTAIGRDPRFPDLDFDMDPEEVSFPSGQTKFDDLFVIGSSVLGTYRQTSLCWGMGIAAGMDLGRKISSCEKSKNME
ncbi:MAG: NAD(P)/FAD-dependent oxidoreductase [Candidatus Thermoplasmatota archaeon]|nr:NAD(P)/FAD-dependent oxidoreductase [Candidatus Thermoplasmatota archaeon]